MAGGGGRVTAIGRFKAASLDPGPRLAENTSALYVAQSRLPQRREAQLQTHVSTHPTPPTLTFTL